MAKFSIGMHLPVIYDDCDWSYRRVVRLEYISRQKGNCCHCMRPLSGPCAARLLIAPINFDLFPVGFFENPVHLHHSRVTGLTIGAVHARCNAYLWQYKGE